MKLSLIVCSRNRSVQLRSMLSRLDTSSLTQLGVEIVLVDSASDDDTLLVMSEFSGSSLVPTRVLRAERKGLGFARNVGIAAAEGEILSFTDDDCYVADDYFQSLVMGFGGSQYHYGMGQILLFDRSDDPRVATCQIENETPIPPGSILPAGAFQGANMFFRREVFATAGLFRPDLGAGTPFPCEDIEMGLRASHAGFTGVQLPSVKVYHNHGRRINSPEAIATIEGYDIGRGAYYAAAMVAGINDIWRLWPATSRCPGVMPVWLVKRLERELRGAADFLAYIAAVPMNHEAYETEIAVHPHWVSRLKMFPSSSRIEHEEHKSLGSYEKVDNKLLVKWDNYPPESFSKVGIYFIHDSILDGTCSVHIASVPVLSKLAAAKIVDSFGAFKSIKAVVPGHDYEVSLRLLTSDVPTFQQTFLDRDYESSNLPASANCILDLGANIGLASVFFGLKYPAARILALEPDQSNYEMLKQNVKRLGDRVVAKNLAVWFEDGVLGLASIDKDERPLGAWGIRVVDPDLNAVETVTCRSLPSLFREFGIDEVDILKVDIEGAELELFSSDASSWLPMVKLLIIETHERFRPGSDLAVRRAVAGLLEELPSVGENLFFRRK